MNANLQTVRQLYFALIITSAVFTLLYFLIVQYYCCPNQTANDLPLFLSSANAVPVRRFIINATTAKDNMDKQLQEFLKASGEVTQILKVDLENADEKGGRIVYTLERFPHDIIKGVKGRKRKSGAAAIAKSSPKKSHGYFTSFSFSGDQLSAATRRLFKLNALARYGGRMVVEPLVGDSSFFGDQLARKSPPLRPLSLYYDMKSVNDLLDEYGYARFASRERFLGTCRKRTGTLYVRLLPNAWLRSRMKLKPKIGSLVAQSAQKGWMRCNLPLPRFQDFALMRELRIVRQICVNTDTVRDFTKLHDEILARYKCVVFHHWSGTGKTNGNYFASRTTKLPALELTHLLPFSSEIIGRSRRFVASALGGKPYISVHIRAERFFRANTGNFEDNFSRFRSCSEFLVKLVENLKKIWNIHQLFLASDLGEHGSSAIARVLERSSGYQRNAVKGLVKSLVSYQNELIRRLTPVVRVGSEKVDKGIEALTDMDILKDGDHLVTVGSGLTWQLWLMDVFRQRQDEKGKTTYSVVKLC